MSVSSTYEDFCSDRGLIAPTGLTKLLATSVASRLDGLLYRPDAGKSNVANLEWALELLSDSFIPPPPNLLPLLPVDESSIACAICAAKDETDQENESKVVRWHLHKVPPQFQGACLDSNAEAYVRSIAEELEAREFGLREVKKIATRYNKRYTSVGRRPPGWETRPVQIACQNVIVGLAAFAHDATIDGLRVPVYLTCEAPHLATHEGNRALSALMLCDAFQNGGTMEIRFAGKFGVPPSLRRYGRSLGITLGAEDSSVISPSEARDLFLGVTPIPTDLWTRVLDFMDRGLISPERLCYTLLAPVWTAIELDYLFATSSRSVSILKGGASFELRRARLGEQEVSRAAHMVGMLLRRLEGDDSAARSRDGVRVSEDSRARVEWAINDADGLVTFSGVKGVAPWAIPSHPSVTGGQNGLVHVVARGLPTPADSDLVLNKKKLFPEDGVALLIPSDMAGTIPAEVPVLLCPDRLAELDIDIERKFQDMRVGRS